MTVVQFIATKVQRSLSCLKRLSVIVQMQNMLFPKVVSGIPMPASHFLL